MASFLALDHRKASAWSLSRVFLSVAILSGLGVSLFFPGETPRHFAYLADAFVHGSFSVNNLPSTYADKVLFAGNIYLPFAPMPGLLLIPFAGIFGLAFDEYGLAILFTVVNLLCIGLLLRRLQIPSDRHRFLLALFFCGTIYLSALFVGRSWFLAHILATTLLLFAILEALSRRRAWLIGVWLGLAFLTRGPTIFSIPFFIWMLMPADGSWSQPRWVLAQAAKMSLGLVVPLLFYAYYNYARFGNALETGYAYAIVGSPVLASALKYGLFSPAHLPKNLYTLLLALPQAYPSFSAPALNFPYIYPSPWGMGLFFTTPAFVYAFAANWRERVVRAAWLAIGLVLVPLVLYYGVGWIQFGYRYALDFYPFLFILVPLGLSRHLDWKALALIILSIVINVWGAWWQLIGFRMLPVELLR
jgi:hypothetical protein